MIRLKLLAFILIVAMAPLSDTTTSLPGAGPTGIVAGVVESVAAVVGTVVVGVDSVLVSEAPSPVHAAATRARARTAVAMRITSAP